MPQVYEGLVEGKASFCWKCGETMVLNTINMKRDKPICDDCSEVINYSDLLTEKGLM